MNIRVGIHTEGAPVLEGRILQNMSIGVNFHWRQTIKALLPGEILPYEGPEHGISIVNVLPVESYLHCVVGSEMNPNAPIEFIKAHAVISRSWAIRMIQKRPKKAITSISDNFRIERWEDAADHNGFDVCNDDHCQRYQGVQDEPDSCRKAVDDTAGLILVDRDGMVADTRFSKCCGGTTESFSTCWQNEDFHYLPVKTDPYCDLSDMPNAEREKFLACSLKNYDRSTSGFFRWTEDVSKSLVKENLEKKFGVDIGDVTGVTAGERGGSGRLRNVIVEGSKGRISIGKELMIRRLFSDTHLYSSAFDIKDAGGYFHLEGKGWGHGVGLCQIGAARMAYDGAGFREILEFYYPESRVESIKY